MQILKLRWNKYNKSEKDILEVTTYMWNLKKSSSKKHKLEQWLPEVEGWRKWRDDSQRVLTSSYKINRFWGSDAQHGITVNKAILYTRKLLKEQILNVLTTKKKQWLCDQMEVLANTTVVITLQNISIGNQHTIHLKLIQCYRSIIPQEN